MSIDLAQVEKPARKIRKLLKKIGSDPAPEQVHHLRTHTRRLEASLAALSLDGQLTIILKKALSECEQRAGKVIWGCSTDAKVAVSEMPPTPCGEPRAI